jgi:hypothetical protein
MTFTEGAKDGRHYWLTPQELYMRLDYEFHFDYDPCPYPRPEGYDGLTADWGKSNYVNPPFGAVEYVDENGKVKKRGATAWARKCIAEYKKGKRVVMVYPIDKWVLMLLDAGAQVRNLGDVKWEAIEDRNSHAGTGRHIAMFILDPQSLDGQDVIK